MIVEVEVGFKLGNDEDIWYSDDMNSGGLVMMVLSFEGGVDCTRLWRSNDLLVRVLSAPKLCWRSTCLVYKLSDSPRLAVLLYTIHADHVMLCCVRMLVPPSLFVVETESVGYGNGIARDCTSSAPISDVGM